MLNAMAKLPDIDYLYASARVRALENRLLSPERLRKMTEAATDEEALKVLSECGYGEELTPDNLEEALRLKRRASFAEAEQMLPEPRLFLLVRRKYDYHNLKCVIKGRAKNQAYEHLLVDYGAIEPTLLNETARESNFAALPTVPRNAARAAEEMLITTGDPRAADTVLDRALFAETLALAAESGSSFLHDYVRLTIDSANLRTLVRLKKMGQDAARLAEYYYEGGTVPLARLRQDLTPEALEAIYNNSALAAAAHAGAEALKGLCGLSAMDLAADNAQLAFLRSAKYIGFGVEPVFAFFAAEELEQTAIHTIMAGRRAGNPAASIMERLRNTYV